MPNVHFCNVEVIELPIVPGADHPLNNNHSNASVGNIRRTSRRHRADSANITIDWKAQSRTKVNLDEYENERNIQKRKSRLSGSTSRSSTLASFLLPRAVRKRILRRQGFETSDNEDEEFDSKRRRTKTKKEKKSDSKKTKQREAWKAMTSNNDSSLMACSQKCRQQHCAMTSIDASGNVLSTSISQKPEEYSPLGTSNTVLAKESSASLELLPSLEYDPVSEGVSNEKKTARRLSQRGNSISDRNSQSLSPCSRNQKQSWSRRTIAALSPRTRRKTATIHYHNSWTKRTKFALKRFVSSSETPSDKEGGILVNTEPVRDNIDYDENMISRSISERLNCMDGPTMKLPFAPSLSQSEDEIIVTPSPSIGNATDHNKFLLGPEFPVEVNGLLFDTSNRSTYSAPASSVARPRFGSVDAAEDGALYSSSRLNYGRRRASSISNVFETFVKSLWRGNSSKTRKSEEELSSSFCAATKRDDLKKQKDVSSPSSSCMASSKKQKAEGQIQEIETSFLDKTITRNEANPERPLNEVFEMAQDETEETKVEAETLDVRVHSQNDYTQSLILDDGLVSIRSTMSDPSVSASLGGTRDLYAHSDRSKVQIHSSLTVKDSDKDEAGHGSILSHDDSASESRTVLSKEEYEPDENIDDEASISSFDSDISEGDKEDSFARFGRHFPSKTNCMISPPTMPSRFRRVTYLTSGDEDIRNTLSRRSSLPSTLEGSACRDSNVGSHYDNADFNRRISLVSIVYRKATSSGTPNALNIESTPSENDIESDPLVTSVRSMSEKRSESLKSLALTQSRNFDEYFASAHTYGPSASRCNSSGIEVLDFQSTRCSESKAAPPKLPIRSIDSTEGCSDTEHAENHTISALASDHDDDRSAASYWLPLKGEGPPALPKRQTSFDSYTIGDLLLNGQPSKAKSISRRASQGSEVPPSLPKRQSSIDSVSSGGMLEPDLDDETAEPPSEDYSIDSVYIGHTMGRAASAPSLFQNANVDSFGAFSVHDLPENTCSSKVKSKINGEDGDDSDTVPTHHPLSEAMLRSEDYRNLDLLAEMLIKQLKRTEDDDIMGQERGQNTTASPSVQRSIAEYGDLSKLSDDYCLKACTSDEQFPLVPDIATPMKDANFPCVGCDRAPPMSSCSSSHSKRSIMSASSEKTTDAKSISSGTTSSTTSARNTTGPSTSFPSKHFNDSLFSI